MKLMDCINSGRYLWILAKNEANNLLKMKRNEEDKYGEFYFVNH